MSPSPYFEIGVVFFFGVANDDGTSTRDSKSLNTALSLLPSKSAQSTNL